MRYEDLRREYTAGGLRRDMLNACPVAQFETWLEQAIRAQVEDPTAMVLCTVDETGSPWQRIVLMKGLSTDGFVFYTNYDSDKARAVEREPRVALLFPWNVLDRQVIVGGIAQRIAASESEHYFATRPRESQVAAWASRQSQAVSDRAMLEEQAQAVREKFAGREVSRPDFWGGYRVVPERIEFWQGGESRLHDRFRYTRDAQQGGAAWCIERLQP